MSHITDVLPAFNPGDILTAAHLRIVAEDINARRWSALLAEVRADARAQVAALAERIGIDPTTGDVA